MGAIRQQISVDVSSRAVWDLLTTADGLSAWVADEARVDARDGGRVVLVRTIDEVRVEDRGMFHQVRPTRVVEITWDSNSPGPFKGTRLELAVGRGEETKVHVTQTGTALDDDATREALETFWKAALLKLRAKLEG